MGECVITRKGSPKTTPVWTNIVTNTLYSGQVTRNFTGLTIGDMVICNAISGDGSRTLSFSGATSLVTNQNSTRYLFVGILTSTTFTITTNNQGDNAYTVDRLGTIK